MKRFLFLFMLVFLAASPGWSKPRVQSNFVNQDLVVHTITFAQGDTSDSDAIGVMGTCSIVYSQSSGDDASLYSIPTADTAAASGTLLGAFTASTTSPTVFQAGTLYVKAVATDATAGGSVMRIHCSGTQVSSSGQSNPFDACRSGNTRGGGYNNATGRYAWTCGNYNWGADQGLSEASYYVDCTGDGTPHTSCLRSGERRLINALYRSALAPYYTEDGGTVFFPKFQNSEHGIYVFTGCGPSESGSENPCPHPYDPAIEDLGYRSYEYVVARMRCGQRGVFCVGEENPGVTDGKSATPKLTGVWFVDDQGNDPAVGPDTAGRDGTNDQYAAEWVFGVGYANVNGAQYCIDSGDGTFTCDTTPSFDNTGAWGYEFTQEHFSNYGVVGKLTNDIDLNGFASDEPAGCFQNGIGVCTADAGEPCNSDSDCSSGTCTIGETTTSATCELDHRVRCWNLTTDAVRSDGGCISDDLATDLGECQPFGTALAADVAAGKDYMLLAKYAACDGTPDASKDVTLCESSDYITPFTIRSFDQTLTTACAGNYAEASYEINFGPTSLHPNNTDGEDEGMAFLQRYIIAGSDGDGREDLWHPIEWSKFDLKGAGFDSIGFMPANWYGRDSATASADCLSGNDVDSTDDEAACDTSALLNHDVGMNGVINNFIVLNPGGVAKSNVDGLIGSIYPTYQNGTIMYGRRNTITDPNWGWHYDNITFLENYSAATGVNFFGPLIRIQNSRFIGNKANPLIYSGNAAGIFGVTIRDTEFIGNSSGGNQYINIAGGRDFFFENLSFMTDTFDTPFRLQPGGSAYGDRKFIKNLKIRNVNYKSLGSTTTGFIYALCSTDAGASGEYIEGLELDGVSMKTFSSNRVPLVYVSDSDTSDCQVIERAGSWTIKNASVEGRTGSCIFSHNGNCDTATGNAWGPNDASDWTAITTSSSLPRMQNNSAMNVPVPDWNYGAVKAANVPDCQYMVDGFTVAIIDDTTAQGTCADAGADGLLDGGGTYMSICKCDPAGDSGDGAWTGL